MPASISRGSTDSPIHSQASEHLLNSLLPQHQQTPNAEEIAAEERKAENRRKADLLRAKLIAQRQNTPMKAVVSRPETPSSRVPVMAPVQQAQVQPSNRINEVVRKEEQPSSDALGLESLLAEGRAAAAAKVAEKHAGTAAQQHAVTTSSNGPTLPAPISDPIPQKSTPKPATDLQNTVHNTVQPTPTTTLNTPARPSSISDAYYTDLPAWLEVTGYHDLAFRTSKLRTYKERKALEEEAARINERLENLRREEQAEMEALRSGGVHVASSQQSAQAPPLPQTMPSGDTSVVAAVANKVLHGTNGTNGIKRAHSPPPTERLTRRRPEDLQTTSGFRIRGANDSPTDARPPTARRGTPPQSIERRISYPDARRRSLDGPRSRDPSLERRQAYYKRNGDGDRPPPPSRYGGSGGEPSYAPRDSRDTPGRPYNRGPGNGAPYGTPGRPPYNRGDYQGGYRGSAGLDLAKGGQSSTSRHNKHL